DWRSRSKKCAVSTPISWPAIALAQLNSSLTATKREAVAVQPNRQYNLWLAKAKMLLVIYAGRIFFPTDIDGVVCNFCTCRYYTYYYRLLMPTHKRRTSKKSMAKQATDRCEQA